MPYPENAVAFKDYNGNGYTDMYLVNVNPAGANPTAPDFLNLNSEGFFNDASDRLPAHSAFGVSVQSADIDQDDDFDIFVSNDDGSQGLARDMLLENLTVVVNVSEAPKTIPGEFSLFQNYPNPFNPSTAITYQLAANGRVQLKIFNLLGQEIRTLVNEVQVAGDKAVSWDGRDNLGNLVSSGVYIYRIKNGRQIQARKLMFIK